MRNLNLSWYAQRKLVILYISKNLPVLEIEPKYLLYLNRSIEGMGWAIEAFNNSFLILACNDRHSFYINIYKKKELSEVNSFLDNPQFNCSMYCEPDSATIGSFESLNYIMCQLNQLSQFLKKDMDEFIRHNSEFQYCSEDELFNEVEYYELLRLEKENKKGNSLKNDSENNWNLQSCRVNQLFLYLHEKWRKYVS